MDQELFGGDLLVELLSSSRWMKPGTRYGERVRRSRNHYNEYIYLVSEQAESGRSLEWVIRVYNDGVAFRYRFKEDSGFGSFSLSDERSSFNLDPSVKGLGHQP